MRSWGDEHVESDAELRDIAHLHGTRHPDMSDRDLQHDEALEQADRLYDKGYAYVEAPSTRERREHFDEARVRNALRPRSGFVAVQPRVVPCTCGRPRLGAGPGHLYRCARYASHVEKGAA